MTIPIRNVYYLLAYAWRRAPDAGEAARGDVEFSEVVDLLASLLRGQVVRLLSRGLDRDYMEREDALPLLRGRPLTSRADFHIGRRVGRLLCRFEELRHDILPNQILKASMRTLVQRPDLDAELRDALLSELRWMHEISDRAIASRDFAGVRLHRNNRRYAFAMDLSELIHASRLAAEVEGDARFFDFRRDEERMSALFEAFLTGFFQRHASELGCTAHAQRLLRWSPSPPDAPGAEMLPVMRPDIELEWPGRRLIVDAKYYADPLPVRYGVRRIRSGSLYQIHAYVRNALRDEPDRMVEGMLLYANPGHGFDDLAFRIDGCDIRIAQVDLGAEWQEIHGRLLELGRVVAPALA